MMSSTEHSIMINTTSIVCMVCASQPTVSICLLVVEMHNLAVQASLKLLPLNFQNPKKTRFELCQIRASKQLEPADQSALTNSSKFSNCSPKYSANDLVYLSLIAECQSQTVTDMKRPSLRHGKPAHDNAQKRMFWDGIQRIISRSG